MGPPLRREKGSDYCRSPPLRDSDCWLSVPFTLSSQSQSYDTTDSQSSASLSWCKVPSGVQDQIFVTGRQLRVYSCGAPSLTRGRFCRLQLLLVLASTVVLGSESRGTHDHILLSQIRDSRNLEGQVPVFIYPRNRVVQLYPQALGCLFVASYDSHGYSGGIRTRLHHHCLRSISLLI
jgi:hypothetical protein